MYFKDGSFDAKVALACLGGALMLKNARYQAKAPYGRFGGDSKQFGVSLDPRLGWFLMELPATVVFGLSFYYGRRRKEALDAKRAVRPNEAESGLSRRTSRVLASIWAIHYLNRGFYFPLSIRTTKGSEENFALFNSLVGAIITGVHGYLNGSAFSVQAGWLDDAWLSSPLFLTGLFLYEIGFAITLHSEQVLRALRPADGSGPRYVIPRRGLFQYVTSPHYLGEITAYTGLWMLTGFSPTIFPTWAVTVANLVPRSRSNHTWYLEKFGEEYAALSRTPLVPFWP